MVIHPASWPDVDCAMPPDPQKRGDVFLKNVINKALAQVPPKWDAVFMAGWCAVGHVIPMFPLPPARTPCQYAESASVAADAGNWATVCSELNHGGGQPSPQPPPSATATQKKKGKVKPKPKPKAKVKPKKRHK